MVSVDSAANARSRDGAGASQEGEVVPGLDEWIALEQWRANWRPSCNPVDGTAELAALFRRTARQGYAAYVAGVRAMPALFALDGALACLWQQGYACARADAAIGILARPAWA
ncbi:hypothetical protein [Pseudoduganella sp. UC29_71]|uniref:hypothetical protein n=1 Tax=Pseudoduganella sp. UC29_71 TaxID=3350174 RepID=UPI00367105BC